MVFCQCWPKTLSNSKQTTSRGWHCVVILWKKNGVESQGAEHDKKDSISSCSTVIYIHIYIYIGICVYCRYINVLKQCDEIMIYNIYIYIYHWIMARDKFELIMCNSVCILQRDLKHELTAVPSQNGQLAGPLLTSGGDTPVVSFVCSWSDYGIYCTYTVYSTCISSGLLTTEDLRSQRVSQNLDFMPRIVIDEDDLKKNTKIQGEGQALAKWVILKLWCNSL